jgi:6-phosphogluconolactonase (cycloisomerase 2 family)
MTPSTASAGSGAISAAADPFGRFVYVANAFDNTVSQYAISVDGKLGTIMVNTFPVPTVPAGTQPQSVAVDPSGRFVYVVNRGPKGGSGSISQYAIGPEGALSMLSTATVGGGASFITTAGRLE